MMEDGLDLLDFNCGGGMEAGERFDVYLKAMQAY